MDERVRFVARLLDGEKMAVLCEEFGISRKTGYKIYQRYKEIGTKGLTDRSRRPHRHANQLPTLVEKAIVRLKKDYPSWGAPKIRERQPSAVATQTGSRTAIVPRTARDHDGRPKRRG
jgi:putative transposase